MIPKIIHYCWFGNPVIPEDVRDRIEKWKKMLPDYKFILWNEDNFDIEEHIYTKYWFHKYHASVFAEAMIKAVKRLATEGVSLFQRRVR